MVVPQRSADPVDIQPLRQVAQRAEALGFCDLWVTEYINLFIKRDEFGLWF